MSVEKRSGIIISASSGIGNALARRWVSRNWDVVGTYRTENNEAAELQRSGIHLVHCDLSDSTSIRDACSIFQSLTPQWDALVICPGTQEPVGPFVQCNFDEWESSIRVNFTSQIRIIHELLPFRNITSQIKPCVLLFAGGGTNNAPVNYSAYIVSKIALIKMCELLDAEINDTRFVILGPGWVKTKIHNSTIKAGEKAGSNYQRTLEKFAKGEFTPMEAVLDSCDWIINSPGEIVSGRNFSTVFDRWGCPELEQKLLQEQDMYKLRRFGNDWIVR